MTTRSPMTPAERLGHMSRFIGFGEEDVRQIQETRDLVLAAAGAIADAVYDHLLSYPETARFFLGPDGAPDREHLAVRKRTLAVWLQSLAEPALDADAAAYLQRVGRAHTGRNPIPRRYMLGTIAFAQAAVSDLLFQHLGDPGRAHAAGAAWNRLLMLHLDLFLSGYDPDF